MRLADQTRTEWRNRAPFFAVPMQIMRRILINHARDRAAGKRGGGAQKISLDEAAIIADERADELVAPDDALDTLTKLDNRKGRVVHLHYFGALSVEEIAEELVARNKPRANITEFGKNEPGVRSQNRIGDTK